MGKAAGRWRVVLTMAMMLWMGGGAWAEDLSKLSDQELQAMAERQINDPATFERYQKDTQVLMDFYEDILRAVSEDHVRQLVRSAHEKMEKHLKERFSEDDAVLEWKQGAPAQKVEREKLNGQYQEGVVRAKTYEEFQAFLRDHQIFNRRSRMNADRYQRVRKEALLPHTLAMKEIRRREGIKKIQADLRERIEKIQSDLYDWIGLLFGEEKVLDGGRMISVIRVGIDSPAEKAKFQLKDHLLRIEKQKLVTGSAEEVFEILDDYSDGSVVKVTVIREDSEKILTLALPVRPWKGGPLHPEAQEKKNQVLTKIALGYLDAALERFNLDFAAYSQTDNWQELSRALASTGKPWDEWELVIRRLAGQKVAQKSLLELQQVFTGPYILPRDDTVKDGWKNDFSYRLDPVKNVYMMYSFGPNGKDEQGRGDDITSEGSQFKLNK